MSDFEDDVNIKGDKTKCMDLIKFLQAEGATSARYSRAFYALRKHGVCIYRDRCPRYQKSIIGKQLKLFDL